MPLDSSLVGTASELVAADTYMRAWFPHAPPAFWMIVFGLFLVAVNLLSVGHYGTFEYWFSLIKVVTIFSFIVIGAALLLGGKVHPQYTRHGGWAPHGWLSALLAVSFGLYSFLGIEMVAVSSGEARSSLEVAKATRIAFGTLMAVYVGAIAVLVGVMPWKNAGIAESPFVTVFHLARIPAAGFVMNVVVLTAALSAANASLYATSRMLFSLARSGYAPRGMGRLNPQGVPMRALLASMAGIVVAIFLRLRAPEKAYLYIINVSLVGGMLVWLISLLAHMSFRARITPAALSQLGLRSPLGAAGSILGLIAIVIAVGCTWWVNESRIAAESAIFYLLVLSAGYWLARWR
jgi:L-asparagine transporter-like permease